MQAFQKGKGAIGAAAIHNKDLRGPLKGAKHVFDLLTKDGEVVRLVIDWYYYREVHGSNVIADDNHCVL